MTTPAQPNFWGALLPPACAPVMDGLETIAEALVALTEGTPVPQRSAEFLAQALRPCLDGDNDIAGRLALRAPGRGRAHQAPATLKKKRHRDELVRAVLGNMAAPMSTGALALQVLWSYCYATGQAAPTGQTQNFKRICELARDHGAPLSHRQIQRIASGQTAYTGQHPNDAKKV